MIKKITTKVYMINLLTGIFMVTLLIHCKENANEIEVNHQVLLSKIMIPEGYEVLHKGPYHPEGESSMPGDSIYRIKKVGDTLNSENWDRVGKYIQKYRYKPRDSEVNLIIKHINSKYKEENANDISAKIHKHIDLLRYDNSTTKIHERKVNVKKSIWYINYSYGQQKPEFFYLERKTSNCYIILKAREHKFTSNDIRVFYDEISKI